MPGAATASCLNNVLSTVTYSPSHRQAGTPIINIQSTHRATPDLCKILHSQFYLVAPVIHTHSLRSHILFTV